MHSTQVIRFFTRLPFPPEGGGTNELLRESESDIE